MWQKRDIPTILYCDINIVEKEQEQNKNIRNFHTADTHAQRTQLIIDSIGFMLKII